MSRIPTIFNMIFNIRLVLFLGALFLSITSYAQPGGGGDPGGGEPVPISGVEILLAGGIALGLKKLNNFRKKIENQETKLN